MAKLSNTMSVVEGASTDKDSRSNLTPGRVKKPIKVSAKTGGKQSALELDLQQEQQAKDDVAKHETAKVEPSPGKLSALAMDLQQERQANNDVAKYNAVKAGAKGSTPIVLQDKTETGTAGPLNPLEQIIQNDRKAGQEFYTETKKGTLLAGNDTTEGVLSQVLGGKAEDGEATYTSATIERTKLELNKAYKEQLAPAYEKVTQMREDYKNGKCTYSELHDAELAYAVLYYQYVPVQEAVATMTSSKAVTADSSSAYDKGIMGAAEPGSLAMKELVEGKAEQCEKDVDAYKTALTAYLEDPSEENLAAVDAAYLQMYKSQGEYNASLLAGQELGVVAERAEENYEPAVLREHPEYIRVDDTAETLRARAEEVKTESNIDADALSEERKKLEATNAMLMAAAAAQNQPVTSNAAYNANVARIKEIDALLSGEANTTYQYLTWAADLMADPDFQTSKKNWQKNGWTWDQRFAEYQVTGDTEILDDLIYGYGRLVATAEQQEKLTELVGEQFDEAKVGLRTAQWMRFGTSITPGRTDDYMKYRDQAEEALTKYQELQDRMHGLGQKATTWESVTGDVGLVAMTEVASIGAAALDLIGLAVNKDWFPETSRLMTTWSQNIKNCRQAAQTALSKELTNFNGVASFTIQLAPSLVTCLGELALAAMSKGLSLPTATSLARLAELEQLYVNATRAEATAQACLTALRSMASNPQYWTSFAHTLGSGYVDARNEGYNMADAMTFSVANAGINAAIEVGTGWQDLMAQTTDALKQPTSRAALRAMFATSAIEEGLEEPEQGVIERALGVALLGEQRKLVGFTNSEEDREAIFSLVTALEEFAGGALIGGIVSGGTILTNGSIGRAKNYEYLASEMNSENMSLPEGMRLEPLDAANATVQELQDYQLALRIQKWAYNVLLNTDINKKNGDMQEYLAARDSEYEAVQEWVNKINAGLTSEPNPYNDMLVLDPLASVLVLRGYPDSARSETQAAYIEKILRGETLTDDELNDFDIDNRVVREVFAERTGLTGIPGVDTKDGKVLGQQINQPLNRGYARALVDLAAEQAKAAIQMQQEQIAAKTAKEDAAKARLEERVEAQAQVEAQTQAQTETQPTATAQPVAEAQPATATENQTQTPIEPASAENTNSFNKPVQKKGLFAKRNQTLAQERATAQQASLSNVQRQSEIDYKSMTPEAVINLVQGRSGIENIQSLAEWSAAQDKSGYAAMSEEAAELVRAGQYAKYLNSLGLTPAETRAIVNSQQTALTTGKANGYTEEKTVKDGGENGGESAPAGGTAGTVGGVRSSGGEQSNVVGNINGSSGTGAAGTGAVVPGGGPADATVDDEVPSRVEGRAFNEAVNRIQQNFPKSNAAEWAEYDIDSEPALIQRAYQFVRDTIAKRFNADVYYVSDGALGVDAQGDAAKVKSFANGVTVAYPDGHSEVFVCVRDTEGYAKTPARDALHEAFHLLFHAENDYTPGAFLGNERNSKKGAGYTIMTAFEEFKNSDVGEFYKTDKQQDTKLFEEFLCRVLARQAGSDSVWQDTVDMLAILNKDFASIREEYERAVRGVEAYYTATHTTDDLINDNGKPKAKPKTETKAEAKPETKTEPAKVETAPEPKKVEPKKVEPAKEEPVKVEPKKAEPVKVEPKKETKPEVKKPTKPVSWQAAKLAEQNGIDIDEVTGSGANGRVLVSDVRSYINSKKETVDVTENTEAEPEAQPEPIKVTPKKEAKAEAKRELTAQEKYDKAVEVLQKAQARYATATKPKDKERAKATLRSLEADVARFTAELAREDAKTIQKDMKPAKDEKPFAFKKRLEAAIKDNAEAYAMLRYLGITANQVTLRSGPGGTLKTTDVKWAYEQAVGDAAAKAGAFGANVTNVPEGNDAAARAVNEAARIEGLSEADKKTAGEASLIKTDPQYTEKKALIKKRPLLQAVQNILGALTPRAKARIPAELMPSTPEEDKQNLVYYTLNDDSKYVPMSKILPGIPKTNKYIKAADALLKGRNVIFVDRPGEVTGYANKGTPEVRFVGGWSFITAPKDPQTYLIRAAQAYFDQLSMQQAYEHNHPKDENGNKLPELTGDDRVTELYFTQKILGAIKDQDLVASIRAAAVERYHDYAVANGILPDSTVKLYDANAYDTGHDRIGSRISELEQKEKLSKELPDIFKGLTAEEENTLERLRWQQSVLDGLSDTELHQLLDTFNAINYGRPGDEIVTSSAASEVDEGAGAGGLAEAKATMERHNKLAADRAAQGSKAVEIARTVIQGAQTEEEARADLERFHRAVEAKVAERAKYTDEQWAQKRQERESNYEVSRKRAFAKASSVVINTDALGIRTQVKNGVETSELDIATQEGVRAAHECGIDLFKMADSFIRYGRDVMAQPLTEAEVVEYDSRLSDDSSERIEPGTMLLFTNQTAREYALKNNIIPRADNKYGAWSVKDLKNYAKNPDKYEAPKVRYSLARVYDMDQRLQETLNGREYLATVIDKEKDAKRQKNFEDWATYMYVRELYATGKVATVDGKSHAVKGTAIASTVDKAVRDILFAPTSQTVPEKTRKVGTGEYYYKDGKKYEKLKEVTEPAHEERKDFFLRPPQKATAEQYISYVERSIEGQERLIKEQTKEVEKAKTELGKLKVEEASASARGEDTTYIKQEVRDAQTDLTNLEHELNKFQQQERMLTQRLNEARARMKEEATTADARAAQHTEAIRKAFNAAVTVNKKGSTTWDQMAVGDIDTANQIENYRYHEFIRWVQNNLWLTRPNFGTPGAKQTWANIAQNWGVFFDSVAHHAAARERLNQEHLQLKQRIFDLSHWLGSYRRSDVVFDSVEQMVDTESEEAMLYADARSGGRGGRVGVDSTDNGVLDAGEISDEEYDPETGTFTTSKKDESTVPVDTTAETETETEDTEAEEDTERQTVEDPFAAESEVDTAYSDDDDAKSSAGREDIDLRSNAQLDSERTFKLKWRDAYAYLKPLTDENGEPLVDEKGKRVETLVERLYRERLEYITAAREARGLVGETESVEMTAWWQAEGLARDILGSVKAFQSYTFNKNGDLLITHGEGNNVKTQTVDAETLHKKVLESGGTEVTAPAGNEQTLRAQLNRAYAQLSAVESELGDIEVSIAGLVEKYAGKIGASKNSASYTLLYHLAQAVSNKQMTAMTAVETLGKTEREWAKNPAITVDDMLTGEWIKQRGYQMDYKNHPKRNLGYGQGVQYYSLKPESAWPSQRAVESQAKAETVGDLPDVRYAISLRDDGSAATDLEAHRTEVIAAADRIMTDDDIDVLSEADEAYNEAVDKYKDASPEMRPADFNEETTQHKKPLGKKKGKGWVSADETGKTYSVEDIILDDPYKNIMKKAEKPEVRHVLNNLLMRLGMETYSDVLPLELFGMLQSRKDNMGVHITMVRTSCETAGTILNTALVGPDGRVMGKSFNEIMLCYNQVTGDLDLEKQAIFDNYRLLLHCASRMSSPEKVEQMIAEREALFPALTKMDAGQLALEAKNGNSVAAEYLYLLRLKENAKQTPVLQVRDDASSVPVAATADMCLKAAAAYEAANPWLAAKLAEADAWWDLFMRTYVVGGTVSEAQYNFLHEVYPHYVPTHRNSTEVETALTKAIRDSHNANSMNLDVGAKLRAAKGSTLSVDSVPAQQAELIQTYVRAFRSRAAVDNFMDELLMAETGSTFHSAGRIVWGKTDPRLKTALGDKAESLGGADDSVYLRAGDKNSPYTITTYRDGRQITAEVSKETYLAFKALFKMQSELYKQVVTWGNKLTGPMKTMITGANPVFAFNNLARDLPSAFIGTESPSFLFLKGYTSAAYLIATNSKEWQTFQALGGTHSNFMKKDKNDNYVRQLLRAQKRHKNVLARTRDNIKSTTGGLGDISESIPRFAEYLATLQTLGDTYENRMVAIHRAAEVTVDFSRAGSAVRLLNALSPYFNPAVQGFGKAVRNLFQEENCGKVLRAYEKYNYAKDREAEARKLAKEQGVDPKTIKTAHNFSWYMKEEGVNLGFGKNGILNGKKDLRIAAWAFLPELLSALLRNLADREKDFEELSDYVKDNYYLIPLGGKDGTQWFRIAKNREWSAVLGNALMRALEGANGYEDPFGTYASITLVGGFLPSGGMPLPLELLLNIAKNSNYVGSAIESSRFDGASTMAKYDEDTSALGYALAALLHAIPGLKQLGLSPIQADYILDTYCGNFYSTLYSWLTWDDFKGMFASQEELEKAGKERPTLEGIIEEAGADIWDKLRQKFVTDSRYSNSTVTRYYDMISQLEADVTDWKLHGNTNEWNLDDEIQKALNNSSHGYAARIQKLATAAHQATTKEEKDAIKAEIVALAHLANDFYNRCKSGEISDPVRYIKYAGMGEDIYEELAWLDIAEGGYDPDDYSFDATFSCPSYLKDPTDSSKQYVLKKDFVDDEVRDDFKALNEEIFAEKAHEMMASKDYQNADKSTKAAMWAELKSWALSETKERFLAENVKEWGLTSKTITLASVEMAELEAEYALQRAKDPAAAVSETVSNELVRLNEYASDYSFVMSTSIPTKFQSQEDSDYSYTLSSRAKTYYAEQRATLYNEAMTAVINSTEYRKASDETRAAMLEATATAVDKAFKEDMQEYLDKSGATAQRTKTYTQEALEESGKYAVTRVLTPDDAYDKKVTDELVRLHEAGVTDTYSFQPPTNTPTSYVDPDDKTKIYVLTEEQQKVYTDKAHELYNDGVLQMLRDPAYQKASDARKAEMLQIMRKKLADQVKNWFYDWLDTHATSVPRTDNKENEALTKKVERILERAGWEF